MILNNKPIAIIPCRLNSKRLPQKNIIKFKKKPIVSWVIIKAVFSNLFSKVIVSSDSRLVENICKKENAIYHKRPKNLLKDNSTVVDVCKDVFSNVTFTKIKNQKFCCIYPTALLLTIDDLKQSHKSFIKSKYTSLISVSKYNLPPFQALYKKKKFWQLIFKKYEKIQSNYYTNVLCDTGMFYWSNTYSLFKDGSFYSKKLGVYKIPTERICDLNDKDDLITLKIKLKFLDEKKIFI